MYMWIQIFPELDSPLSSAQTLEVTVIISFNQIFYFHNSSAWQSLSTRAVFRQLGAQLSQITQNSRSFSTEAPKSQVTPQSWTNHDGSLLYS